MVLKKNKADKSNNDEGASTNENSSSDEVSNSKVVPRSKSRTSTRKVETDETERHNHPPSTSTPQRIAERREFFNLKIFLASLLLLITALYLKDMDVASMMKHSHGVFNFIGVFLPKELANWFKSFHTKVEVKSGGDKIKSHDWMEGPNKDPLLKVYTKDEIKYVDGGPLYLVLIGHVFDVSNGGGEYYKPGSGYHAFIGQDASRSFITGEFAEGVSSDLEGLQPSDYKGIKDWLKFYLEHETYQFVGYLEGKYFDKFGKETKDMLRVKELMKNAEIELEKGDDLLKLFPSCNVEWKADTGSKLWCSTQSGGVSRDWTGYPRKFFDDDSKKDSFRCACVHPNHFGDPRVELYDDCPSQSTVCRVA